MKRWRAIVSMTLCMALAAPATTTWADDVATSQVLFDKAKELTKQGKWAEACPLFEESQRLAPTNNTLYYLADCQEHVGKTASAWANFTAVADKAKAAKEEAKEKFARKRADGLWPTLCKLEVRVLAETAGLVVKRNGVELPRAEWGLALPIDPSSIVVDASASGMTPFSKTVKLEAGACNGKTELVEVPALEKATGAEIAAAPPPTTTATTGTSTPPPVVTPTETTKPPVAADTGTHGTGLGVQRTLAIVAGGAGLVALGVGFALRTSGKAQYDDAVARCTLPGPNPCSEADANDAASGRDRKTLGWIVVGTGGALVAGGLVLWLTAPSQKAATEQAHVSPWVGAGVSGVQVIGRF